MPDDEREDASDGEAGLSPGRTATTHEGDEEGSHSLEQEDDSSDLLLRTPFRRPRAGALRNILATLAVGAIIVGLVYFFDRPSANSSGVNLTAEASGPAPQVNKEAPDFRVQGLDGQYFQLSDFRGRPVWINFWATWCPPCRAENPDIQAVYEANKDKGLVIVAVDIGEDSNTVKGYVQRIGLTYTIGLDWDTAIAAQYRIAGIPTHFFVDKDGIIRDWRIGGMSKNTMEKKVEAIMSAGTGAGTQ